MSTLYILVSFFHCLIRKAANPQCVCFELECRKNHVDATGRKRSDIVRGRVVLGYRLSRYCCLQ